MARLGPKFIDLGTDIRNLYDYREDGELVRIADGKVSPPAVGSKYKRLTIDGETYLLHRLIYLWHHGTQPPLVDHRDENKRNNRISNLREATKQENEINSGKSFGSTGFRGVSLTPQTGRYRAYIVKNYKQIHLGVFATPEEASARYEAARAELYPDIYGGSSG